MHQLRLQLGKVLGGICVFAAFAGCAPQPARSPSAEWLDFRKNPSALIRRIAALRGLPERRSTPVYFHEPDAFAELVETKAGVDGGIATPLDVGPVQLALGLLPESAKKPGSVGEVQRQEVVAFYDQRTQTIHVKDDPQDSHQEIPLIIAHEIGHSLQHQYFQLPDVAQVSDEDVRLARLALLEGDAMLSMLAYAADDNLVPLTRVLAMLQRSTTDGTIESYMNSVSVSLALRGAPPFVRERLVFPYFAGATFLGSLYRAGGFELVNRSYGAPPESTEQILHPERYLAGEPPIFVSAPEPPAQYEVLLRGRLGELMLRQLLARCNTKPEYERAAAGWGGDSFSVARSGKQGALLISTVWDSEIDATEFEFAMRRTAACWDQGSEALRALFVDGTSVVRSGNRVLITRGIPKAALEPIRSAAFRAPLTQRVAQAPFGLVVIPPLRTAAKARPPYFDDLGRIVSEYFGLVIPVPRGYGTEFDDNISITRHGSVLSSALFGISNWVFSRAAIDRSFAEFTTELRKHAPHGAIEVAREDVQIPTPIGTATVRFWRMTGTTITGRLLLVPLCRGTGALIISQIWSDEFGRRDHEWMLQNLSTVPSPICTELDP